MTAGAEAGILRASVENEGVPPEKGGAPSLLYHSMRKGIFTMAYTKEDIIRIVKEEDIEFIRMQFVDIFGQL